MMLVLPVTVATVAAATTVIDAGQVFDGTAFLGPGRVVIDDGRVTALLHADAPLPAGASVVDARGDTVTPGLIDAHLHLWSIPLPYLRDVARYSWGHIAEEYVSRMARNRQQALEAGITTVVDLGSQANGVRGFSRALERGRLGGPRWVAAGPVLTAPGGHPASTLYVGQHDLVEHAVRTLATPADAPAIVDELTALPVDVIKVVLDDRDGLPTLSEETVAAVVTHAHSAGIAVAAHVGGAAAAAAAVRAGVDFVEHPLCDADDTVLSALASAEVVWTPTLSVLDDQDGPQGCLDAVSRALALGVPVAAGSDFPASGGWTLGDSLFGELAWLERAGATRTQALAAATSVAARKVPDLTGTLTPGEPADLVVHRGDLADGDLDRSRVVQVWQRGAPLLDSEGTMDRRWAGGFRRTSAIPSVYYYYEPVNASVFGSNLSFFDPWHTGIAGTLNGLVSVGGRVDLSLSLSTPSPIPRTALSTFASFSTFERLYFGTDIDASRDDGERYAPTATTVEVRGDTEVDGPWTVGTTIGVDAWSVAGGPVTGGTSPRLEVALVRDRRDNPTEPWTGTYAAASVVGAPPLAGPAYAGWTLDLRGYLSPVDWHVGTVRVLARQVGGPRVPVWALPEVGGAVGRGFVADRFLGEVAVVGQAEVRSRVWKAIHVAAFADVGQVATSFEGLRLDAFRPSVGPSLRIRINNAVILAYDVGFGHGPDGWEPWILTFHYGHGW